MKFNVFSNFGEWRKSRQDLAGYGRPSPNETEEVRQGRKPYIEAARKRFHALLLSSAVVAAATAAATMAVKSFFDNSEPMPQTQSDAAPRRSPESSFAALYPGGPAQFLYTFFRDFIASYPKTANLNQNALLFRLIDFFNQEGSPSHTPEENRNNAFIISPFPQNPSVDRDARIAWFKEHQIPFYHHEKYIPNWSAGTRIANNEKPGKLFLPEVDGLNMFSVEEFGKLQAGTIWMALFDAYFHSYGKLEPNQLLSLFPNNYLLIAMIPELQKRLREELFEKPEDFLASLEYLLGEYFAIIELSNPSVAPRLKRETVMYIVIRFLNAAAGAEDIRYMVPLTEFITSPEKIRAGGTIGNSSCENLEEDLTRLGFQEDEIRYRLDGIKASEHMRDTVHAEIDWLKNLMKLQESEFGSLAAAFFDYLRRATSLSTSAQDKMILRSANRLPEEPSAFQTWAQTNRLSHYDGETDVLYLGLPPHANELSSKETNLANFGGIKIFMGVIALFDALVRNHGDIAGFEEASLGTVIGLGDPVFSEAMQSNWFGSDNQYNLFIENPDIRTLSDWLRVLVAFWIDKKGLLEKYVLADYATKNAITQSMSYIVARSILGTFEDASVIFPINGNREESVRALREFVADPTKISALAL